MQTAIQATPPKVVHTIPATINLQEEVKNAHKQLRVAAYCRVSTKQEDQLNSYDVQRRAYTDKINGEPGWTMVGIYADKGITGTDASLQTGQGRYDYHQIGSPIRTKHPRLLEAYPDAERTQCGRVLRGTRNPQHSARS